MPACNFSTSQLQKVVRTCCVLYILICKCASRYSGTQFFHIPTSKTCPTMRRSVHFDLQTCFSLQRRAIFPHLNFKKWSEHLCFLHFDFKMCFSLQRRALFGHRKVFRDRQFFSILTCKCASRCSGLHILCVRTSKRGPNMLCFVHFDLQMCFSLQRRAYFVRQNFQKWSEHAVSCTF